MTLRELMSVSADDTWFRVIDERGAGRAFYNADFLLDDKYVMEVLKPFLDWKVKSISLVIDDDICLHVDVPMMVIELEEK